MTKKLKIYQVLTFVLGLAFIGLCLFVGITAVQKQMRLKVSFNATPSIYVEAKLAKITNGVTGTFESIFNNSGTPTLGTGITLTGNKLTITENFTTANSIGASFKLQITNLMSENGLKASFSGTGAAADTEYVVMKEYSTSNTDDTAEVTVSGNSASSIFEITFSEYNEYTVTVAPSSGNFTFSDTTNKIAVSDEDYTANVKANTGYNLTISITNDGGTTTLKQNTDYTWDSSTGALKIFSTAITGNITITCTNNNAITYQIAYNSNGGSGTMSNSSHTYGVLKKLTSCTFTAPEGKEFAGWAETPSGAVKYPDRESVSNLATTQDAVVTLYAVWKDALPYTIYQYGDTANGAVSAPNEGWNGYSYIVFDNCTTYNGYDLRWIIIGTGTGNTTLIPDSDSTIPDSATNSGELDENEVLLLSEKVLFTDAFQDAYSSGLWKNSDLKTLLNGTFLTETGLGEYAKEKTLKTTSTNEATGDETTDQIFLLAHSGIDSTQSYCVQTYLGTFTSGTASSNPRMFSFSGASSSYWWLRSGFYYSDYYAYDVYDLGYVDGSDVYSSDGVRPSFVLNLA